MPLRLAARLPLVFLALALVVSCGGKRRPALADAQAGQGGAPPAADTAGTRGRTQAVGEGRDVQPIGNEGATGSDISSSSLTGSGEGGPLADIHFELDSSTLSEEARGILEKHALWLQGRRGAHVTIEGHCDERGTTEYNLALGEQRARATRDYLASLGVAGDRMKIVSFGKERPIATGADEASFAQNRRAHFAVAQ
jgi:peptidoglycan-associated lipoprotein